MADKLPGKMTLGAAVVKLGLIQGGKKDEKVRRCGWCDRRLPSAFVQDGDYTSGLTFDDGKALEACRTCLTKHGVSMTCLEPEWTLV